MAEGNVYISYSWKVEDKNSVVEKLLTTLVNRGINIKRDVNEIGYGDPIRIYMDKLAAGSAIILVLSVPYFQSPNCMYELREIYRNNRKAFRKRIFPIVLEGTRFHRAIDRIPYVRYWETEKAKLKDSLGSVDMINMGHGSHDELKDYDSFARMIDDLQALLADINHWTEEAHLQDDFDALIERIVATGVTLKPVSNLGSLYGVPSLPVHYMPRPGYLSAFQDILLKKETQAVGITGVSRFIGVQGMGGIGKSVLAAALVQDEAVRATFPDGIFWLRFRQDMEQEYLLETQTELLQILKIEALPESVNHGRNLINLALHDKRCLLVMDDVWVSRHVQYFDISETQSRFLLTTRNSALLSELGAIPCPVDLLFQPLVKTMHFSARLLVYSHS